MTNNKSQGQCLNVCGVNIETKGFSHGQLYLSCLSVGKPFALFVRVPDKTKKIEYQSYFFFRMFDICILRLFLFVVLLYVLLVSKAFKTHNLTL